MAFALMRRLAPAAPRPAPLAAVPADMILMGQVPWGPDAAPSASQEAALLAFSPRLPLAGLLAMNASLRSDYPGLYQTWAPLASSPDNPLVYSQISRVAPGVLAPIGAQALAHEASRHPNSYGLSLAQADVASYQHDVPQRLSDARRAAADAPGSPETLLILGDAVGDAADAIRYGRTADAILPTEWAELTPMYVEWTSDLKRAATLDPRNGLAWYRLAAAATFTGQDALADGSFWKAYRREPDRATVYSWGLQMFQDKWGGDPATLAKVAHLAATDTYADPREMIAVSEDLGGAGSPELQKALQVRASTQARAAVQDRPNDASAHFILGKVLEGLTRIATPFPNIGPRPPDAQ